MRKVIAISILLGAAFAQEVATVQTRFGVLSVSNSTLLFRGQPLRPRLEGNSSLDVGKPYQISASDVVLVTNYGGTACPYLYAFVTTSKTGAEATPCFGTCNQALSVTREGKTLLVKMHGFRGPFEPAADRARAESEMHVFTYRARVVSENGKPVPESGRMCR